MVDTLTTAGTSAEDWEKIHALFDGEADDFNLESIIEGIEMAGGEVKTLVHIDGLVSGRGEILMGELEDLLLLPDGRIVLTDSDDGLHEVTDGPVADVDEFIANLRKLLED